jgi:hypothetical protein
MAVFLGPRHTTAEDLSGRRKAREMAWMGPIGVPSLFADGGGMEEPL